MILSRRSSDVAACEADIRVDATTRRADLRSSRLERIVLFTVGFLILATGAFWDLPAGKSVAGALVILDGGVPYRDFWTMYAPGQFYAVAMLFWLFGRELLVQALAACVAIAASAVVFNVLVARIGARRSSALAVTAVFIGMFWTTAPELTDYQLALPFLLLAVDRAVRYSESGRLTHLRWTGIWLGLAAWFKHDISAYFAAGMALGLCLLPHLAQRRHAIRGSPSRAVATMTIFALVAAAPLAAWTAWTAPGEAWADLFLFPALVFSDIRGEQFPPLIPDLRPLSAWMDDLAHVRRALDAADALASWVVLYAPVVIFLAGLATLAAARHGLNSIRLAALTLCVSCMPFFWAAAHVQQNTHPYTLAILGAPVVFVFWSCIDEHPAWRRRLLAPLAAAAVVYGAALMTTAATKAAAVYYEWQGSRVLELDGLRGIRAPARVYDTVQPVGEFFRTSVPAGEPIYAGLLRHDSIVINNALLYAIADRRACCGYTELHPGVADRAPVQTEIVRRLESHPVRAIVLWEFGWSREEMERRKARAMARVPDAGSTILDRYIQDHFDIVRTHGEYHILWRRGVPSPRRETAVPSALERANQ